MKKSEKQFYNEVIKPQISNLIKKSGDNSICVTLAYPNGNVCGFTLIYVKNILTGDERIQLTAFGMSNTFLIWCEKNYELFIEMFKENGITPYFFSNSSDERVISQKAMKALTMAMDGNYDYSIDI